MIDQTHQFHSQFKQYKLKEHAPKSLLKKYTWTGSFLQNLAKLINFPLLEVLPLQHNKKNIHIHNFISSVDNNYQQITKKKSNNRKSEDICV